ncbi:hypothetical protein HaLaN_20061, partial [Haematococcus lacustris]
MAMQEQLQHVLQIRYVPDGAGGTAPHGQGRSGQHGSKCTPLCKNNLTVSTSGWGEHSKEAGR